MKSCINGINLFSLKSKNVVKFYVHIARPCFLVPGYICYHYFQFNVVMTTTNRLFKL